MKSFQYDLLKTKTHCSLFLHSTRLQSWKRQLNYHHTRTVCLQGDLLVKPLLRRTASNGSCLSWPYCKEPEASERGCSLGWSCYTKQIHRLYPWIWNWFQQDGGGKLVFLPGVVGWIPDWYCIFEFLDNWNEMQEDRFSAGKHCIFYLILADYYFLTKEMIT